MNIQQYLGVLELALNALRPVSDLLHAVAAGESVSDDDWRLLASYSWGQDRGRALGERDLHDALLQLAQACPSRLSLPKTQLYMLALGEWAGDEARDPALANEYRQQLELVLTGKSLQREVLSTFIYSGASQLSILDEQISTLLVAAIEDPEVGPLKRIGTLYGWAGIQKRTLDDEEPLPAEQQAWLIEQISAAKAGLNSYQQHTALDTIWETYYRAGLEKEARAALAEGMDISKQPYYFMAGMGYLERELGNEEASLNWYRKAWEASQGAATRVQWGTNYMFSMIKLSPDALDEIRLTGTAVFRLLAEQPDGLHHRSRGRMNRLSTALLEWSKPAQGDATTAGQRSEVISVLRAEMDKLCVDVDPETESAVTCVKFLVAEVE